MVNKLKPSAAGGKRWYSIKASATRKGEADIYIYSDIGAWGSTSADFVRDFRDLGKVAQINLHINSMGGDVFDGLAIYNTLVGERDKGAGLTVYIDGIAASIASIIAMAGQDILMPESSFIMIHDPSGMVWGTAEEMDKMAETMRGIKDSLVRIYAKRTSRDPADITTMMADETWMDGPKALAEGFATQIIDAETQIAACATSRICDRFRAIPATIRNTLTGEDKTMPDDTKILDETAAPPSEDDAPASIDAIIERIAPKNPGPQIHSTGERPGTWNTYQQNEDDIPPDPAQQQEQQLIARQKRYVADVKKLFEEARLLDLMDEAQQLLTGGVNPREASGHLIQIWARKKKTESNVGKLTPANSGARVISDYEDPAVIREQMSDAIAYPAIKAMNPAHKLPDNGARKFINFSATDNMRVIVRNMYPREDPRNMTKNRITDEALGNTTSDFPNILGVAANKVFLSAYSLAVGTYRAIASQQDLPNFQPNNMVRAGDFPALFQLNEHGEITRGSISESAETAQLKSHGRTFGISRQVLINDNLGVFTNMAAQAGRAVAVYENRLVWAVLLSNPTLATTNAQMFSTTHKNLTSSGTAISAASLGIGRAAMRVQKSLDGNVLNVAPAVLVVPASKETIAEQVISPLVVPEATSNLTPVGLRAPNLALVVEPLLDDDSTLSWYLFGQPGLGSNLIYGYLSGNSAPRVRTNSPFNVDGIEFQVLLDFYAAAIDFRFGYKNAGA